MFSTYKVNVFSLICYFLWALIGHGAANDGRMRRSPVTMKEGRCPARRSLRNCSRADTCGADHDCPGIHKCCKTACKSLACSEPIDQYIVTSSKDHCPVNKNLWGKPSNGLKCERVKTKFCSKDCRECCIFQSTCNPNPGLFIPRETCTEVLCSKKRCRKPGEACLLNRYNRPQCACLHVCPRSTARDRVCATDGITYRSACELNRTACILGNTNIKLNYHGKCGQERSKPKVQVEISSSHRGLQVLQAFRPGVLTCAFTGKPRSITWHKEGWAQLSPRMVPRDSSLVIAHVFHSDAGVYRCVADEGRSKVTATLRVKILGSINSSVNLSTVSPTLTAVQMYRQPQSVCSLEPLIGSEHCQSFTVRWHYEAVSRRCRPFVFSGCGGNKNNFQSRTKCERACSHLGRAPLTSCRKSYQKAKESNDREIFVPQCRPDGSWSTVQCHKLACFCVDHVGREVPSTRAPRHRTPQCANTNEKRGKVINKCERERSAAQRIHYVSDYVPNCKPDGSYEEVQCSAASEDCWCVDRTGNEIPHSRTKAPLKCPRVGGKLTACQQRHIMRSRKGHLVSDFLRCDSTGKFEEVQCEGMSCYCVDTESGREIAGTRINVMFGRPRCNVKDGGLTSCQRRRQESFLLLSVGEFVPQCKADGRYEELQCHGSVRYSACWCRDSHGREIPGSRTPGPLICPSEGPTLTLCQRLFKETLNRGHFLDHHFPRCTPDGRFEPVQCVSGSCYCVKKNGREVAGTRLDTPVRTPNCAQPEKTLSPCEQKRLRDLNTHIHDMTRCKPDGTWQDIQCGDGDTRQCWCVDQNGQEINGTRSNQRVACQGNSSCWTRYIHLIRNTSQSSDVELPWCRADGEYNRLQCHKSYCFCVDRFGKQVPGTHISSSVGLPKCTDSGSKLTSCQQSYQRAVLRSSPGGHVPRCKPDGDYEELQCHSSARECWCLDRLGREIHGTRTKGIARCPVFMGTLTSCQKRYIFHLKSARPNPSTPRCRQDGSYEDMQCEGRWCFCVDRRGRKIPGSSLPMRIGVPKCGRKVRIHLTLCQREHKRSLSHPASPSLFIPSCKLDGRFEELQCSRLTGHCWCVDERGREVSRTRTTQLLYCPGTETKLSLCQRHYQETLKSLFQSTSLVPRCRADGEYEPIQCERTGYCYCVNEYGIELQGTRMNVADGQPNCSSGRSATLCQEHLLRYLNNPQPDRFEPRCKLNGDYQEIQCHDAACFCVDKEGTEIQETRKKIALGKPLCSPSGIDMSDCQKQLKHALSIADGFVHRCKADGRFEEIQCHQSSGDCWCVDQDGNTKQETVSSGLVSCPGIDVSAECWSHYQTAARSLRDDVFVPRCTTAGQYSTVQVYGSQFVCVNEKGEEIEGTSVSAMLGVPGCDFLETEGHAATSCQRQRAERMLLSPRSGAHVPMCQPNGSYADLQCDLFSGYCWCVDREGRELKGTRSKGQATCDRSDVPNIKSCQRHRKKAIEESTMRGNFVAHARFIPQCKKDGGYTRVQCYGYTGQCWCVDGNGNELWGTVTRKATPNCTASGKLTACQYHRQRTQGLLGKPPPGRVVPVCMEDGTYRDFQCHDSTGLCWCVDHLGREIPGTRQWGRPECLHLRRGK